MTSSVQLSAASKTASVGVKPVGRGNGDVEI